MSDTDDFTTDPAVPLTTEAFFEYADVGRMIQLANGRTAFVAHVPETLFSQSRATVVTDEGETRTAVVGALHDDTDDGGLAWASDIEDNDSPTMDDVDTPYGDLQFGEINVRDLIDTAPTTDSRDECPVCGAKTLFRQQWNHDKKAVELRQCSPDSDDAPRHICVYQTPCKRTDAIDTHEVTLISPDGESTEATVHGFYQRRDTGNWSGLAAVGQGDDDPRGIYTAREVATFINRKMDSSGDSEQFGIAQMGGSRFNHRPPDASTTPHRPTAVTWWDDGSYEWRTKTQFVPVGDFYDIENTTQMYGPVPSDIE